MQLQQAVEERDLVIRKLTEQLVLVARKSIDDMTQRGLSIDCTPIAPSLCETPRKISGNQMPPGLFRRRTMSFLLDPDDRMEPAPPKQTSATIPYWDLARHPSLDKHRLETYLSNEDCVQYLGIPRAWLYLINQADLADRKWRASLSAFHFDIATRSPAFQVSSPTFLPMPNKDVEDK